jgi:hypothetical protein
MNIKPSTKQVLTNFFNDLGSTIIDNESSSKVGYWTVECNQCQCPNEIRVSTLIQNKRVGGNIVCVTCKRQVKVDKFLERSRMVLLDDHTPGGCTIKCAEEDCGLIYGYNGDFFDHYRCFCQMKIKQDERVIYKFLQETFPDSLMAKEELYLNSHKVDLYIETLGKKFYIEIDDENHFLKAGARQNLDGEVMRHFLEQNKEDTYFIRIPTKGVYCQETLLILEDFIKTVQNDNKRILLFMTSPVNRYLPLDIPEDEYEIHHVTQ